MSTIIECPACSTRYKMNKAIPEGGRYVKCARCGHQWRMMPEEPEELTEELQFEPDPAEISPTQQDALAAFADAPEPQAPSWDVRRGQFAATIASLSEMQTASAAAAQDEESAASSSSWSSDWDGASAQRETDAQSGEAEAAYESGEPEQDAPAALSFETRTASENLAWRDQSWAERDNTVGQSDSTDFDPEYSVRQALRAALEDHEKDEDDSQASRPAFDKAFDRAFGGTPAQESSLSRASYAAESETEQAIGTGQVSDLTYLAGLDASRMANVGDAPLARERQGEDEDDFQSDPSGLFRPQDQQGRGFPRSGKPALMEDSFGDYDTEQGAGSDDDRYMADSPLDADAAALQAAIEGSMREKHEEETRTGGGLALAAAWAVFISVLSGVALAFITFRDDIVTALPGTGTLYDTLGFEVQNKQIDFGAVSYRWTVTDGKPMIEVTGQIINLTDREITVPRVLINVRDGENGEPVKATATVRSEPLAANETADFTLEFLSPPKTINQIELAFAEDSAE